MVTIMSRVGRSFPIIVTAVFETGKYTFAEVMVEADSHEAAKAKAIADLKSLHMLAGAKHVKAF